jgi:hypothetical protein
MEYVDGTTLRYLFLILLATGLRRLNDRWASSTRVQPRIVNNVAFAIAVLLATLWLGDLQRLEHRIYVAQPDSAANWTMVPADGFASEIECSLLRFWLVQPQNANSVAER